MQRESGRDMHRHQQRLTVGTVEAGNVCAADWSCQNGACVGGPICSAGFADCDAVASNGCEVDISTDVNNCGSCGNVCSVPNATAVCTAGSCSATCTTGFSDCDGNSRNGCEANLNTDRNNCGYCGNVCSASNGGTAVCTAGSCSVTGAACRTGYADCNGLSSDGCEVDINTDLNNCGGCGNVCSASNGGTVVCTTGSCSVTGAACRTGYADCNGLQFGRLRGGHRHGPE